MVYGESFLMNPKRVEDLGVTQFEGFPLQRLQVPIFGFMIQGLGSLVGMGPGVFRRASWSVCTVPILTGIVSYSYTDILGILFMYLYMYLYMWR